jgi:pimeloyl-ACP methyl ester carboxylesterase
MTTSEKHEFTHTVASDGAAKGMTFSGRRLAQGRSVAADTPLVIALHGGTFTSAYFDVPGYSLLDRAKSLSIPILAIDRPSYGRSTRVEDTGSIILKNAEVLDHLIGELWDASGARTAGIVLIGHSIGGAIATALAARHPSWPLLGIAISGCLLQVPPESADAWAAPELPAHSGDWWLVITPDDADVCDADPGYPVAVTVTGSLRRMIEIWRGKLGWPDALRSGAVALQGPEDLRRAVPPVVHPVGLRRSIPAARIVTPVHYALLPPPVTAAFAPRRTRKRQVKVPRPRLRPAPAALGSGG